jgi:hypothetical protein
MAMQEIIGELKLLPDVQGGFFFHRKNGMLYKDVPAVHKDSDLNDMGRQLTKIYAARRLNFPDIRDINLYFTGLAMLSRAIDEQCFLVLLCDQNVNSSTLSVSVRLAIEEHGEALTLAAQEPVSGDLTKGTAQPLSPQQALDGPLKRPLAEIQHTLIDLMGPMAEFVYEENLEKWIARGPIGVNQLPELIELIASDMPDVKKSKDFKDRCRNLM